jgi:sec-independent protein translocase protein TatA
VFENLSLPHLLMVLAVTILVFGPKRIPEIAGSMGKGIREFKRHISGAERPDAPSADDLSRFPLNDSTVGSSNSGLGASAPPAGNRGEPKRLLD